MTNLSSLIVPLLLLNITNQTQAVQKHVVLMDFSKKCPTTNIRLDDHKGEVEIRTDRSPDGPTPIKAGLTCSANFMTGRSDHGICFEADNIYFKKAGVNISLWTTRDAPDVVFNRHHYKNFTQWCTDMRIVTLEVSVPYDVSDQNSEFRFSFSVKNRTKADIAKIYNMDSYKECNLHHKLDSGKTMMIRGHRLPAAPLLPSKCWMTISSSGTEESEQLCMTLTYSAEINCQTTLDVTGFHEKYWKRLQSYSCQEKTGQKSMTTQEMCSEDKKLTFELSRKTHDDVGLTFTASIKSKKHTHWKLISAEREELRGLDFVKGLTYFIATIDSLAGIFAAVIATMLRHPKSFWKAWAESFTLGVKADSVHYEVNYPVVSCSHEDEGCSAKEY